MKKITVFLVVILCILACSHIDQIGEEKWGAGGQSIQFLDKDTLFLSAQGDSAEVKSHGYFFYVYYLYAIQGRDTLKYRWGDNGEFEMEDSTSLQTIEGSWYKVRTLSDKEPEQWCASPVLPIKIAISVLPNLSLQERKLLMEVIQMNSHNRVYVIQGPAYP